MNTNQLYFDGSLGQFIRKANYEQVSVNPHVGSSAWNVLSHPPSRCRI